jgi:alanine racemase
VHRFSLHEARVDAAVITQNVRDFLATPGDGVPSVDVRADGYGHGAQQVARAVEAGGAKLLLVSSVADGDALTAAGIQTRTVVVSGDAPGLERGIRLIPIGAVYGFTDGDQWRSAMRVAARVIGVKAITAGEGVSYGYTFRAEKDTNLALVAIGYANGIDRFGSNTSSLLLRDALRPVVGRVAMNALVLDMGDEVAAVGDTAVVFGEPTRGEPSISSWSSALGKNPAEVAANAGGHLPRSYR